MPSYSVDVSPPRRGYFDFQLKDGAAVVASGSGTKPLNLSQAVVAGRTYDLVVTPRSGKGTATVTATYPGGTPKQVVVYDAQDHATSVDDGTKKVDEILSPSGRVLRRTVRASLGAAGVESDDIFGYDGGSDSPAYTRPYAGGTLTTYLSAGAVGAVDVGGTITYQHANAHGDIGGTTDAAGTWTAVALADEWGVATATPGTRLGWLGKHQRYTVGATPGLIRMGVRLYDPKLGRFLGVDPIEGGSCTDYLYACADPINKVDLAGTFHYTLNFDLGPTGLSASEYMSMVAANFGDVFPIGGAPDTLPGAGANVDLNVRRVPFPVYLSRRSADGWAFGTRFGHPDHKGWVSFKFTKSRGRMRLQIRGYVPDYSLGACKFGIACFAFRKRIYRGIASRTWTSFAGNLRAQGW